MQFPSDEQVVGQLALEPLHRYGEQLGLPAEPPVTFAQVPSVDAPAATLHASHAPLQVVLQHTPSTQLPDAHSPAELQLVPLLFFVVQLVPLQ